MELISGSLLGYLNSGTFALMDWLILAPLMFIGYRMYRSGVDSASGGGVSGSARSIVRMFM